MKNIEKSVKIILPLTLFAVFIICNYNVVLGWYGAVKNIVAPIFFGIIVALVLSIPINVFEKKIFKFKKEKVNRALAIATVIMFTLGLIVGLCFLIIPHIIESIEVIVDKLPEITKTPLDFLKKYDWGKDFEATLDKVFEVVSAKLQEYLPNVIKYLSNFILSIFNISIGIFLGVLIISNKASLMAQKEKLEAQFKLKEHKKYIGFSKFMLKAKDKFSKFLSGQIFEALLFGLFVYLGCTLLKLPYALLIAFIMAVSNLIPMIGGYIGGILSFIFIFTVSLKLAIIFVVFIVVLQQIEQMTTYPIIVGKNVNLSSFWVLVAVLVGGGLFGFWGLILSVPLLATIFEYFIPIDKIN